VFIIQSTYNAPNTQLNYFLFKEFLKKKLIPFYANGDKDRYSVLDSITFEKCYTFFHSSRWALNRSSIGSETWKLELIFQCFYLKAVILRSIFRVYFDTPVIKWSLHRWSLNFLCYISRNEPKWETHKKNRSKA